MCIGNYDSYTVTRGLIKFTLPSGINPAQVVSATLTLQTKGWVPKSLDDAIIINVHKMLVSWKAGNAIGDNGEINSAIIDGATSKVRFWGKNDGSEKWSIQNVGINDIDARSTIESSDTLPKDSMDPWKFDLTNVCKEWLTNPSTNFGVLVKASNDQSHGISLPMLWSGDAPIAQNRPALIIIYKK